MLPANADIGCAFFRQGLSKNADNFCRQTFSRHFPPPKCRQTSSKMQMCVLEVLANCRRIMQAKVACDSGGDACILVCLHNVAGFVYSEMQAKFVYSTAQRFFRFPQIYLQQLLSSQPHVAFRFFGLSSQHHDAFRFLGIGLFVSGPPAGSCRAGAGFLVLLAACPVLA